MIAGVYAGAGEIGAVRGSTTDARRCWGDRVSPPTTTESLERIRRGQFAN